MKTPARTVAARILGAKVYSALDYFKFFNGILFTLKKSGLMAEIYKYDLFERIPAVKIPVYFFVGKYDYNTPWELVEQYYNTVDAPLKKLIWFDKSAHSPNIEENKKFCDELINISEERAI